jgi:putative sterol carrier protein
VDVLCNFIKYDYRTDEIKAWLTKKLDSLLEFQNTDGGFADQCDGLRTFDGWTRYREPQGLSNAFATWFRLIAIGMIAVTLYDDGDNWQFRKTIGIGYFNPDYLSGGFNQAETREAEAAVLQRAHKRKENQKQANSDGLNDDNILDLVDVFQKRIEAADQSKLSFEASYSVNITGEGSFHLIIRDGSAVVRKGALKDADLTVTCKRDTLTRIVAGKLDAKLAYATGKLKCKGDIAYAFKLTVLM